MQVSLRSRPVNTDSMNACRVLQPGNPQLSGAIPLGTPYPVLRYNGPSGYSMCSQLPCARKAFQPPALRRRQASSQYLSVHWHTILTPSCSI